MLKIKKTKIIDTLKQVFSDNSSVMLLHYHGLNVVQMTDFRRKMYDNKVKFSVVKNTLAKIALKDTGFASIGTQFLGPIAIIATNDPVAAAKGFVAFAKANEAVKFVGGYVDGKEINYEGVKMLSTIPSLDELRAKIIALLSTPASSLLSILGTPGGNVARTINAYSQSK